MLPVGDSNLEDFPAFAGKPDLDTISKDQHKAWIQSWYADLASALAYMHSEGIRHQDIKPSNIIHKGNQVFFTDFSSCARFQVGHTTSTANPAQSTAMYAAPEADLSEISWYG
jgi:serine/threonine protein kinase